MALVVGIGNPTRSDDGAGLAAAAAIANLAPEAEVIEVHQLTPELAERVAAHAVVVFIDASVRVTRTTVAEVVPSREEIASHGGSPGAILSLAKVLYGASPDVCVAVEIPVSDFSFGERLSNAAARGVEEAVKATVDILRGATSATPLR